jgi:NAD(P)-dependent dehydrogenase (short-subunit alcohol dehydrogenase family)
VLRVNLTSVFLMCRGAIPRLQAAGGGCIINVASILALRGHRRFDTHAYAAAKGGIAALGRAMAVRYAGDRIRVCTLCPGLIRTPMSARAQADPEILSELAGLQPLGGDLGSPEDVAGAALFLASDTARFLTGVELPVDGGWSVR